jgi:electron transfer flavoprotein alpha subunit
MSVIVFAENWEGKFKKTTFEAVSYGRRVADMMGVETVAVVIGALSDDASILGKYGANKVMHYGDVSAFDSSVYAAALKAAAESCGAKSAIVSGTFNGKSIVPSLSIKWEATSITNISDLPESVSPMRVKRSAFSSKGYVNYEASVEKSVLSIIPNGIGLVEFDGSASVEEVSLGSVDARTTVLKVERASGSIPLPEAEIVISGGRGLKGPENWGMVEELASLLGAGTACSKPVSDMHWRPHSEHVGQTGIAINPNLYVAIGISGAIQHLAGVSKSKTIVVINSDQEAPFFKAADYGVVGDAFQVVPKLIEAVKGFQAQNG